MGYVQTTITKNTYFTESSASKPYHQNEIWKIRPYGPFWIDGIGWANGQTVIRAGIKTIKSQKVYHMEMTNVLLGVIDSWAHTKTIQCTYLHRWWRRKKRIIMKNCSSLLTSGNFHHLGELVSDRDPIEWTLRIIKLDWIRLMIAIMYSSFFSSIFWIIMIWK